MKVVIVDDKKGVAVVLRVALQKELAARSRTDVELVVIVEPTVGEALPKILAARPDVVSLDFHFGGDDKMGKEWADTHTGRWLAEKLAEQASPVPRLMTHNNRAVDLSTKLFEGTPVAGHFGSDDNTHNVKGMVDFILA